MIAYLGLTVACQKKATKTIRPAAPSTDGQSGNGTGEDECTPDTALLLAASGQQEPVDASKLITRTPVKLISQYDDLVTTLLIGFEAPYSEENLKYYPNFGKIELLDDRNQVIYTRETATFSNEIVVPTEYHNKKISIRVSACADPTRLETNSSCGDESKLLVTSLSPISQPEGIKLNEVLWELMLNEDNMQQLCLNFKKVSDSFLAIQPQSSNESLVSLIATAQLASFDSRSFMALCSSYMLDDLYEVRQDISSEEGGNSAGLLLTNSNCDAIGNTGTGTDKGGPTLSQLENDCNARDGYVWNSENEQCDFEETNPPGIDYVKLKEDCLAKTADDTEFTWDEEGNVCVQTVTKTEELAGGESECIKQQGNWDVEKNLCSIKLSQVDSFKNEALIDSFDVDSECLQIESSSITSATCDSDKETQLFTFSKTDDEKVLIKNTSSSGDSKTEVCIKLGDKGEDSYPVVTETCSTTADEQKFELIDIKYDGETKVYRIFKSTVQDDEGNYYCLEKTDGTTPTAKVCLAKANKDTKKPQLFELKFKESTEGNSGKVEDHGEILDRSSLVAEGGSSAGKQCIAVGADGDQLGLADCNADDDKQKFDSRGSGRLEARITNEGETTSSSFCIDYSDIETSKNLVGKTCGEDDNQQLTISKINVSFAGEQHDFQLIKRNDGVVIDQCLTVDGSKLVFEECKFKSTTTYDGLKTQLFTVVKGGGSREDYGKEEGGWFDGGVKNPFAPEHKNFWLTSATVGLIVIGVGLMAHAAKPAWVNELARGAGNIASWPFRDKYVNAQTRQGLLRSDAKTTVVKQSDFDAFKAGNYTVETDKTGTKIKQNGKKIATFDSTGKASFEVVIAGSEKMRTLEVYENKGRLRQDLNSQRRKRLNGPATGSRVGRWAKGFAGVLVITGGGILAANSPGAGLVAEAQLDCINLDSKAFNDLSESAAFNKFLCEVGRLEFELAQFHSERQTLKEQRDEILKEYAEKKENQ